MIMQKKLFTCRLIILFSMTLKNGPTDSIKVKIFIVTNNQLAPNFFYYDPIWLITSTYQNRYQ